jgi:hypothetical protein
MIISRCPDCGWEAWDTKPIIKICCGHYVEHKEVVGEEKL